MPLMSFHIPANREFTFHWIIGDCIWQEQVEFKKYVSTSGNIKVLMEFNKLSKKDSKLNSKTALLS